MFREAAACAGCRPASAKGRWERGSVSTPPSGHLICNETAWKDSGHPQMSFLGIANASFFSFTTETNERKKTRCSQQVPRYCRMLQRSTFFFFFNYYFGRSAVFPWLPFVKIPAAGIRVNSRSSRGSPEVGCCGLGQGEDAGIAQCLHCQQCLPPAPPLP